MNNFQNTASGAGILKDFYGPQDVGPDPLSIALKKRREKLMQSRLGVEPKIEPNNLDSQLNNQTGLMGGM
jgi:hypothetical protein